MTGDPVSMQTPIAVAAAAVAVDQCAHPGGRRVEERRIRWRWCGAARPAGGEEEASSRAGECSELGHHLHTETVGVGGIDAADERVDEAVVDLAAESLPDEGADRVAVITAGENHVESGSSLAPPCEQVARGQPGDLSRHTEDDAVGDRVEPVEPDGGVRHGR